MRPASPSRGDPGLGPPRATDFTRNAKALKALSRRLGALPIGPSLIRQPVSVGDPALLIGATHIGRLLSRPRLWAIRAIRRGRFGTPVVACDGARRVPLETVEAVEGVRFMPVQLAAAGIGRHWEDSDGAACT